MDAITLQEAATPALPIMPINPIAIQRTQVYFPAGDSALFGFMHRPNQNSQTESPQKNCVVVICNPMGYEYTHSHRSLRHLADQLASAGFPTLRFDYHGTGDSPGSDLDTDRVQCWQQNIHAAIDFSQRITGCTQVCLLGIRMGATLAALVASTRAIDFLVLWNPCTSGRRYIREMQAIAATGAQHDIQHAGIIESAGFLMTQETAAEIKSIDLLKQSYLIGERALIIARDDLAEDTSLFEHLIGSQIAADHIALPGYIDMMAEPQFTIVPTMAIATIGAWLTQHANAQHNPHNIDIRTAANALDFSYTDADGKSFLMSEQSCRFGDDGHLFGILSFVGAAATEKPAVLLLNSGTVHRAGPNRLYVTLARKLAAQGYTCFRVDLEGLGDSVLYRGDRENHPYPAFALSDTEQALRYLRDKRGCSRFILLGLCSGAHAAFHAGIELTEYDIVDIVAINPLTYRWVEGMSLDTTQHFQDVAYYKKSARSMKSWLKLLRGKVNLFYLAGLAGAQLQVIIRSLLQSLSERFFPKTATQLAQDLKKLFALGRPLNLFIAADDPGYEILVAGAKYTTAKAIKTGHIHVQFIANGNHTFSTLGPRTEAIRRICQHINARFGTRPPDQN